MGGAPNIPPEGAGTAAVDLLALKVNRELLGAVVVVAASVAPNLKGSVGTAGVGLEPEPVKLNIAFFALLAPSSVEKHVRRNDILSPMGNT